MATRKGPIRVLHYGLGPIGAAVVRQVAERRGFRIVGAVDIDPAKAGRDLGEVAGIGRDLRVKLKVPIVSTTEELAYPTRANMKYAAAIHNAAKKAKVAVLGTGVNPGFTMDALPITLTGVCERVDSVLINRIQDASIRRLPFQ